MTKCRSTVYNNIVTPEKLSQVNPENIQLGKDFLEYLSSVDRSKTTINAYENDLKIFWVWLLENCNNKFFIELSKREVSKFQSHCLNEWGWSSARVRRVKSTLSSLSNYVESILDDEFENFRPIIRKIENPVNNTVREKTVFSMDQLQQLLDNLVDSGQYDKACMLSLAINSGRRKSELVRMKVSYFTDDNIIYGSLYKTPEQVQTKGRGSKGKMLTIYTLKNGFKKYLDLWLDYRKKNNITSEWLIPAKVNGEYVDEQISISTMDSWADSFTRFLGVPFYWHALRHLFTTECSRSGLPDDVIQMLIGWNSLDMVSLYKDISADEQFEKYFSEDGIKKVENKSLSDL